MPKRPPNRCENATVRSRICRRQQFAAHAHKIQVYSYSSAASTLPQDCLCKAGYHGGQCTAVCYLLGRTNLKLVTAHA